MNGTIKNNGSYLPKSVNIINNGVKENPFKKTTAEKELLKKLKNKNVLYFQNKVLKSFDSIR